MDEFNCGGPLTTKQVRRPKQKNHMYPRLAARDSQKMMYSTGMFSLLLWWGQ